MKYLDFDVLQIIYFLQYKYHNENRNVIKLFKKKKMKN